MVMLATFVNLQPRFCYNHSTSLLVMVYIAILFNIIPFSTRHPPRLHRPRQGEDTFRVVLKLVDESSFHHWAYCQCNMASVYSIAFTTLSLQMFH
jgi:hypothetical protein